MWAAAAPIAPPHWDLQPSGTVARLRAVSAVDARVAWASGSGGVVIRTVDGGRTWAICGPVEAAGLDFRDIEAFDAETAVVLSIGPGDRSRIYRTADGGATWSLQFANADPRAFYDAMAFWDRRHGVAVGDPVDGRFTVLRTDNGGGSWSQTPAQNRPVALPGEGMFAASGTCLIARGDAEAWFATGGADRARVFRTRDGGSTWSVTDTPIAAGGASAGIFSLAFLDSQHGMAVGGDYRREQASGRNVARTGDGGRSWTTVGTSPLRGFRSGVVYVPRPTGLLVVAVGPSGGDYSHDGGATWSPTGDDGFHAVSVSPTGDAVWAVGERGRVGRLAGYWPPRH